MSSPAIEPRADAYRGELPARILSDILRRLSYRRYEVAMMHIAMEWILIVGIAWLCSSYWNPLLYVLAVLFIGGRLHALAILMHDGSHYLLCKQKSWNDWISDIFLAWPILITTESYRTNHREHHRYTNTEKDPDCLRKILQMDKSDWEYPALLGRLLFMALKDLTGIGFFETFKAALFLIKGKSKTSNQSASSTARQWARLIFYTAFSACAIYFHFWKGVLLFWAVPFLTAFNLCLRIRTIAEHFATQNDHPLNITRTTLPAWWEKPFFPKNVNYHLEHHLHPSVPFYWLPELHKALMEQPEFRRRAHITRTYFGVLKECLRLPGPKRSCLPLESLYRCACDKQPQ